jgi:hypothetical protein
MNTTLTANPYRHDATVTRIAAVSEVRKPQFALLRIKGIVIK